MYDNKMFDRLVASGLGTRIGTINCVTPTSADDLAISSEQVATLQALVNIDVDYSILEKFLLQPTKSVIISYLSACDKKQTALSETWTMYGEAMPVITEASHGYSMIPLYRGNSSKGEH